MFFLIAVVRVFLKIIGGFQELFRQHWKKTELFNLI